MPFARFTSAVASDKSRIHVFYGLVVSPGMKPAATLLPS